MHTIAIITGFLAGPSLLLILARRLGGKSLVHRIWRWGLQWLYRLGLLVPIVALIYVATIEGLEGDDGPALFVGIGGVVAIAVSGVITLLTYRLLTRYPEA